MSRIRSAPSEPYVWLADGSLGKSRGFNHPLCLFLKAVSYTQIPTRGFVISVSLL
uniref:Uncharacterized protein n=1 Tax=Escherichia coli TaxID=562 RepID=A0A7U1E1B9_ECOLX|nr:hypothetical protein [Escherichia coli]